MSKKIGRNDPCPCESGKKYKNCCLPKGNLLDFTHSILQRELPALRDDLANYAFSMPNQLKNAYRALTGKDFIDLETMLRQMQEDTIQDVFFEWFLFDYTTASGSTPFMSYINKLQNKYRAVSPLQLREWNKTPFSIYQVKGRKGKDEYILEDIFTQITLTLYPPEIEEEIAEGTYLILRALPAGQGHVYLFSLFSLNHTVVEGLHRALKTDKDHNTPWQVYLKEKGDLLLKLIQDEENIFRERMEQQGYTGVDIEKVSRLLGDLYLLKEEFTVKFKELKGLTLLQACWEPDIRSEFLNILAQIDDDDVFSDLFQLDENLLDKSNWDHVSYYDEACLLLEKMKGRYFPLEIEVALTMWQEFSTNQKPNFHKKGVWAAAVEYALSYLNYFSPVRQKDLAAKYGVSTNSISKNYYRFLEYWDAPANTEEEVESNYPFDIGHNRKTMERDTAALHEYLQQVKPKDEAELQKIFAEINEKGLPKRTTTSPQFQSQELIYDAWEAESSKERIKLARKALGIYPHNADAYLILAGETAMTLFECKNLLSKGLEAGEKSLGPAFFQDNAGHFWGIVKSRPYMRVKSALAQCLWKLGEKENAIQHFRELLELNPNDNQGIRDLLPKYLLATGKLKECQRLLAKYNEEHSANWFYNKALVEYRLGSKPTADLYLRKALRLNPYVPDYLLGKKVLPLMPPPYYSPGAEDEAQIYAIEYKELWLEADGALQWLQTLIS